MKKIILSALAIISVVGAMAQQSVANKSIDQRLNDEYCTGMFKTTDGTIIDVADNPSINAYFNILDWLEGRVAGVQVFKTRSGTSIPVIRGRVAGIFIDEISVTASALNSLSVHDIAMIKVIKTPFYGGFNSGGGAIAIYTLGTEEETEDESK